MSSKDAFNINSWEFLASLVKLKCLTSEYSINTKNKIMSKKNLQNDVGNHIVRFLGTLCLWKKSHKCTDVQFKNQPPFRVVRNGRRIMIFASAALPLTPTQFYIKCCIPIFEKEEATPVGEGRITYPLLKFKTTNFLH